MGYDTKTMMYETPYGEKISYAFLDGLNRADIRKAILLLLEEGFLKNATSLKVEFGDSVESAAHPGSKSSGCVVPRSRWKGMLGLLEFNEEGSSTEGWIRYSITGLGSTTKPDSSQCSYGSASYIEFYDWGSRTIEHSFTVHYRKRDGGFTTYFGNIEDFYEQIATRLDIKRLNKDFNL